MIIDHQIAQFSDTAYRTAVLIYLLALAVSLVYYGFVRIVKELRRERERALLQPGATAPAATKEKVAVGAAAEDNITGIAPHSVTEDDLPPTLQQSAIDKRAARADMLGGISQALIWLAIAIHATHLILRGVAAQRFPWGNLFEYISVVTLFSMIIAAGVLYRKHLRVLWPWVLTPIMLLLFYGGVKLYAETAPVVPALKSNWYYVHVSTVSIGAGIGLLSGMASVMYLLRRSQPQGEEKGLLGAIVAPLPDAAQLDAFAYRAAIWALPIFGLGIVFGAIWADAAWGRFWGWDPKETVALINWILYAAYLHARATPGWRGIRAAIINVAAFATMVFNLFFINLVVSGLHSYAGVN